MPQINKSIIQQRTATIDAYSDDILTVISQGEILFFKILLNSFIDKLQVDENGNLLNNSANKRLVLKIDSIWLEFITNNGAEITNKILDGVDEMLFLSKQYYKGYDTEQVINEVARAAREETYNLLGVDENGLVVSNGFVATLLRDETIPAKLKAQATRNIVAGQNKNKYRDDVETQIKGDDTHIGVLSDFYKDAGQDVIAQTDRVVSVIYADNLKLNFAIYEGSLIKTSRVFCIEHAGKVYHRSEIEKFNPPTAKPPTYNPFIDLGGYNCRHHLNWISDELALKLRPEAAQFIE